MLRNTAVRQRPELGTVWTTFVSLERLGVRVTIWSACALNIALALFALALAQPFPYMAANDIS